MTTRFPVSVKGVLLLDGRVLLLRNEREEWELPGGKLDPGEQPADCLRREIREELALAAEPAAILDSWLYRIAGHGEVLVVTYGCRVRPGEPRLSAEHRALGLFLPGELADLAMPEGYKRSIRDWLARGGCRSRP